MLNSHPAITCGPELSFFSHRGLLEPGGLTTERLNQALFSNAEIDWGLPWSSCPSWNLEYYGSDRAKLQTLAGSAGNLPALFEKLAERRLRPSGNQFWVENSPTNIYGYSAALGNFTGHGGMLLVRHPLAVVDSLVRRGVSEQTAIKKTVFELALVHFLLRDTKIAAKTCLIRFERLLRNTEQQLTSICTFLGVENDIAAMRQWERDRGGDAQRHLPGPGSAAASHWQRTPLDSLDAAVCDNWKDRLSEQRLELLRATTAAGSELRKYVDEAHSIDGSELCEAFGYEQKISIDDHSPEIQLNDFYRNKSTFSSLLGTVDQPGYIAPAETSAGNAAGFSPRRLLGKAFWSTVEFVERMATKHPFLRKLRDVLAGMVLFLFRILGIEGYGPPPDAPREAEVADEADQAVHWHPPPGFTGEYDVLVIIAFLGRHDVLRFIVSDMCEKTTLRLGVVLACSTPEDEQFASEMQAAYPQVGYVRCANKPLGRKWQHAVEHARLLNPAALMIVGSDDYVTPGFIENNFRILADQSFLRPALAGPRTWYMVSVEKKVEPEHWKVWRVSYKNAAHHILLGAGRMYSREILDRIDWKLFDIERNALLDSQGYNKVVSASGRVYNTLLEDGSIVSIKGQWGALNSVQKILDAKTIICTEQHGQEKTEIIRHVRSLSL